MYMYIYSIFLAVNVGCVEGRRGEGGIHRHVEETTLNLTGKDFSTSAISKWYLFVYLSPWHLKVNRKTMYHICIYIHIYIYLVYAMAEMAPDWKGPTGLLLRYVFV